MNWPPKIYSGGNPKVTCHNIFQLIEALVDSSPPLPLEQGLGDLLVGVGAGQRHVGVARAP